ncbi:MAG: hypothetical protein RLZZ241_1529 [Bacteroidota bacterium]
MISRQYIDFLLRRIDKFHLLWLWALNWDASCVELADAKYVACRVQKDFAREYFY